MSANGHTHGEVISHLLVLAVYDHSSFYSESLLQSVLV